MQEQQHMRTLTSSLGHTWNNTMGERRPLVEDLGPAFAVNAQSGQ